MQSKKKGSSKKLPIRKKINKSFLEPDETFNTTKQRTFATIEETFEFHDHKTSTRTTHYTSKRDYLDRMQANKLSPFSSPGHSISPRQRKSVSPIVVKQKQRKKNKKSLLLELNAKQKKTLPCQQKTNKTPKNKPKPVLKAKAQFQNQFLKRMNRIEQFNGKKITELSEQQMQGSIRKRSKQPTEYSNPYNLAIDIKKANSNKNKKADVIKKMHCKIKQKYKKTFPKLKIPELKVLSAIVLIQRLWRQRKVKQMIGEFLSPRAFAISENATFGNPLFIRSVKEAEQSQIQYTMKTQKSLLSVSPKCNSKSVIHQKVSAQNEGNLSKKQFIQSPQNKNSSDYSLLSYESSKSDINLKDLELSDELSSAGSGSKNKQMLKYVDMYRQVFLHKKKQKKKNKKSRPNAFNFPQSLSQKCLLEKLYKKSFSNLKKDKNTQSISEVFFPQKNLQKSKEYISPSKPQIVELQERFYTEAQDEELLMTNTKFQKQPMKPEDQTVGTIGQVAQQIINFLMNQFSEEYQAFTSKKCLKKKKKLPGIHINENTMNVYLDSFAEYVSQNYGHHMKKSIKKITPSSFLKVFRICPEESLFQSSSEYEEEQEDEQDYKIIPKITYFEYQQIYEDKLFNINDEQKKYSNFVSGLIKVHNKCLSDAFSEILEKERIDNIILPWDSLQPTRDFQQSSSKKFDDLRGKFDQTKLKILKMSKTNLGKLRGRDTEFEEANLLLSLKDDYKREGKDWSCHEDKLEIRLELAQMITQALYGELMNEFPGLNSSKQ